MNVNTFIKETDGLYLNRFMRSETSFIEMCYYSNVQLMRHGMRAKVLEQTAMYFRDRKLPLSSISFQNRDKPPLSG